MGLAPAWVRRHGAASAAQAAAFAGHAPAAAGDFAPVQVEALDLAALAAAIVQCQACPRALARRRAVAGEGPAEVRLMVIDLVPSQSDASLGVLRDTDGARVFEQLLFAVGLKREAVYLSHALRCDGLPPSESEANCCAPYLQREIALLAPRALLALGAAADASIRAHAGLAAPRIFTLPHPDELVGNAAEKRAAWSTLRELRSYLAAG
jgi:DNA polymerase